MSWSCRRDAWWPATRTTPASRSPGACLPAAVRRSCASPISVGAISGRPPSCCGSATPRRSAGSRTGTELSVDSATGCLAGPQALAALHAPDARGAQPLDGLVEALGETERSTWCWANHTVGPGGNVIAFSTGYGDGSYPVFWGLAADGGPVCLLVDLRVLDARHDPDRA